MKTRNLRWMIPVLMGLALVWAASALPRPEETKPLVDPVLFSGLKFRNIGPSRGGRVTTVAGVAQEPGTFYMGATGGGVWKTVDYGQNWANVSDGFFSTGSIGAIRVAPSIPAIIYVGTGSDGIRSNVITGRGVYKSIDSGRTWTLIGLRDVGQIGAVEVHPTNPDIVFVAAIGQAFGPNPERGVFRSKDGGQTWEKVLFLSPTTGACDLEFAPGDPTIVYASMWHGLRKPWTIESGGDKDGFYRSSDGGSTWTEVKTGLPTGLKGKSDLAVSAADPKRVYLLYEAPEGQGGVYRSDDFGLSFRLISTYAPLLDRPFYYCNIDADPNNADVLYVNATSFFKSVDAGKTWTRASTPHGDNHDMWIDPRDSRVYIQSNDGGANVTRDGGKTWSTQDNQPTAELYQVAVDDQFPYWVYAGQQDNSTIMVPSLPPFDPSVGPSGFWRAIGGCETGPAVPKPGNSDIVYANCKGQFGRYNKKTGEEKRYWVGAQSLYGHNPKDLKFRFQRVSPIHVSPHDPNVVYHGSQYLHRTTDEGVTWETISPDLTANEPDKQVFSGSPITRDITGEEYYSTIYAVQESTLLKGLIWVGANDGPVHVTRDAGRTWTNVTPKDMPKGGRVQAVEPSPHRPGKAYFAAYRYLLNDWKPYIYRTDDYGKTWKLLTTGENGIPIDSPTRVVREDPNREGLLYAGTEFGLFISFDDGGHWQPFQLNLPVTPVTDIQIVRKDIVLSTMGRSFWIMDNVTPLHQIQAGGRTEPAVLLVPRDAYRTRMRGAGRSNAGPEYPAAGAMIDYVLAAKPQGDLRLEILDENGLVVRTFGVGSGASRLDSAPGTHRFVWDMRREIKTAAPAATTPPAAMGGGGGEEGEFRAMRSRGPLVVPGTYQSRLTVGDWSRTVGFKILMDPRIEADGVTSADLKAQERIILDVLALQARAREIAAKVEKEKTRLIAAVAAGGPGAKTAKTELAKVETLRARLVTAGGRYPQGMLLDQIGYLASLLDGADQKPGRDAYVRLEELTTVLDEIAAIIK